MVIAVHDLLGNQADKQFQSQDQTRSLSVSLLYRNKEGTHNEHQHQAQSLYVQYHNGYQWSRTAFCVRNDELVSRTHISLSIVIQTRSLPLPSINDRLKVIKEKGDLLFCVLKKKTQDVIVKK